MFQLPFAHFSSRLGGKRGYRLQVRVSSGKALPALSIALNTEMIDCSMLSLLFRSCPDCRLDASSLPLLRVILLCGRSDEPVRLKGVSCSFFLSQFSPFHALKALDHCFFGILGAFVCLGLCSFPSVLFRRWFKRSTQNLPLNIGRCIINLLASKSTAYLLFWGFSRCLENCVGKGMISWLLL